MGLLEVSLTANFFFWFGKEFLGWGVWRRSFFDLGSWNSNGTCSATDFSVSLKNLVTCFE